MEDGDIVAKQCPYSRKTCYLSPLTLYRSNNLHVTLLLSALLPVCEEVRSNLRPGAKKEPDSPTLPYPGRLDSSITGSSNSLNTEHQVSIVITTDDNPDDQAFEWPSQCQNMLLDPGIVNDTQTQALLLTTLVRALLGWSISTSFFDAFFCCLAEI